MSASDAVVASAPGRVNLIGEHLDYNGGRCLPIALPLRARARVVRDPDGSTSNPYVQGTLAALGVTEPLRVELDSEVPVGSGLSSSAALICSVALAVDRLLDLRLSDEQLLEACIRAETEHVGAPTGGLDQSAALFCRAGVALLLDFATGARTLVPFAPADDGVEVLVIDTGVSHANVTGGYGDRRRECEEAAGTLGVRRLVDASLAGLGRLGPVHRRRAMHVLTEQRRVDAFVGAAGGRDWVACGALMTASHRSLRDDFEVSCAELDTAVTASLAAGAFGARMTGGGFGGSAIALVPRDRLDDVRRAVDSAYAEAGWQRPSYHSGRASAGACVENGG